MSNYIYSGGELDIFKCASNWKKYWHNHIKKYTGNKILEVGAGIGATAEIFNQKEKPKRWICLEPDSNLCKIIEEKKKRGIINDNIEVKNGTLSSIEFYDTFDMILYIDVLEHIENDKEELVRASRLLDENGRIIILSPAYNFLYSAFDEKIGHFRRYDKKLIHNIIPASLKIIEIKYLDSAGFFASLANKIILKSSNPTRQQVKFWDRFLVPISQWMDPLIMYRAGKSILVVMENK